MHRWLRLLLALGLGAGSGWAVDWKTLRPQGYVSDFAGVLDRNATAQLGQYCGEVERATDARIVLVTLASLEAEPLDDVAQAIFTGWRDPHTGADRRVMVLLAIADRRRFVASGGGLDAQTSATISRRVLRAMRPALRKSDYADALRAAADAAGQTLAASAHVPLAARLTIRNRGSLADFLPWPLVIGAALIAVVLLLAGNPPGYGDLGGRGLLSAIWRRDKARRSDWGSRGGGGFGGYDSGDGFGGFGGAGSHDW